VGIASAITGVWALGHWIGGTAGTGLSALNFFFESSTMGTILILFVYLAANVALPFYYRKYRPNEFNVLKHIVLPVLAVVVVAIPIYYLFKPPQPQPYNWFPWVGVGLIVVFILYSIWLVKRDPGLGDRVGSIVADE
jgi:amino acid transporter